jgi:prophage DNA circulation protein
MTDILSRQLLSASFKGVEFRVRDEIRTEAGRRIVLHDYPNSNQRFVEDLGQIPDRFIVDAFVHGTDYLNKARALRVALNEAGPGELRLPNNGTLNAYALAYSDRASQSRVGEIEFSLEFALGRPNAGPTTRERNIEDLYEQGDAARGQIELALSILYDPPQTAWNTAVMQFDIMQQAQGLYNEFSQLFDTDRLNSFDNTVQDTLRGRGLILRDSQDLASTFIQGTPANPGLWQQISLYTTNAIDTSLRNINFGNDLSIQSNDIANATPETINTQVLSSASFDATINQWPETTNERKQRNSNRRLFTQSYRTAALVNAYEQAAAADYQTEQQVSQVIEQLNQAYNTVMRQGINGNDAIQLRSEVRTAINDVRFIALEILERKAQASPGITNINLNASQSAFLLTYNIYAEEFNNTQSLTDRSLELRRLNPALPAMTLKGDVTVFDRETN